MAADTQAQTRTKTELELLQSMYPDRISIDERAQELIYSHDDARLTIRLTDRYLVDELPMIVAARAHITDVSDVVKKRLCDSDVGEEVLDSLIVQFDELCADVQQMVHGPDAESIQPPASHEESLTVVVWLHHLLNVNKRKQAKSPSSPAVAGVTKPGYPGVLVFSGPGDAVNEHVEDLRRLQWQAFQVRLRMSQEWTFAHGSGVVEVEAMKDVMADVGEARKDVMMEAMRMK